MKLGRLMFTGAVYLAGTTMAARAQSPEETRAEIPSLVRDAFDSEYGKAMVAELGKSLRKDADAACLSAKGRPISSSRAAATSSSKGACG